MIAQVDERIADMTSRKEDTGVQLRLKAWLEQLKSVAMLQWVEAIADHLMLQMRERVEVGSASGTQSRGRPASGSIKASKGALSASIVPITRSSV